MDHLGNTSLMAQTTHSNLNVGQTALFTKWNGTESWWGERRDQSTLVETQWETRRMREEWRSDGVQETLLLPKSIGDSQPRDRRLPASSLHSATTGKKRRAELINNTCEGKRSMKTVAGVSRGPCFHKSKGNLRSALLQVPSLFSLGTILHALRKHLEEEPAKSETLTDNKVFGRWRRGGNFTSLLSSLWLCVKR